MRIQSELNTDLEVYRLKGELLELREQNRVLRSNLVNCAARLEAYYGEDYPAVRDAKAALTATSQPTSKKGDFPHHPAFDEYGEHR
jgi:hypothetical protein